MKYPSEQRWIVESLPAEAGWRRFVVMVLHGGGRWHFHLCRNDQRFVRSADLCRLCDRFPLVAAEVAYWAEAA